MNARNISRRSFLKRTGAALTSAWLLDGPSLVHASGGKSEPGWGVLVDLTRCDGCNSCVLDCKDNWDLPHADVAPEALSSDAYAFVETRQAFTAGGQELTRYVKRQCMHCLDAACVSACPAAAMYKSAGGAVLYRAERCLGCRYCQVVCPFGVPRFDWDNGVTPVISKCQMCYNLVQQGQAPACVQACPTGALRFGKRQDLLVQARAQIVSNPGRYVDHVFGELEVGGTAVLYLSDVPFEQLGFPTLSHTAPPEETEKIMSKLPYVLGGMLVLTSGTAAYTHSRSLKSADEQGE